MERKTVLTDLDFRRRRFIKKETTITTTEKKPVKGGIYVVNRPIPKERVGIPLNRIESLESVRAFVFAGLKEDFAELIGAEADSSSTLGSNLDVKSALEKLQSGSESEQMSDDQIAEIIFYRHTNNNLRRDSDLRDLIYSGIIKWIKIAKNPPGNIRRNV